jgi:hypothetical protein
MDSWGSHTSTEHGDVDRILRQQWCCGPGQGEEKKIKLVDKNKKRREKPYLMTTNILHNPCGLFI